jgi:hypothetical protein
VPPAQSISQAHHRLAAATDAYTASVSRKRVKGLLPAGDMDDKEVPPPLLQAEGGVGVRTLGPRTCSKIMEISSRVLPCRAQDRRQRGIRTLGFISLWQWHHREHKAGGKSSHPI